MGFFEGYIILSALLTAGYIVLIFLFTLGLRQTLKQKIKPVQNHSTKVSLIIPARNEALTILKCLNDLIDQDYPGYLLEVMVTDDFSEDHTIEFVHSFIKKHPEFNLSIVSLKEFTPSESGKKKALSRAINVASGELIITTDADTTHETTWITSIVNLFITHKPYMILGPVAFHHEKNFLQKIQSLEFIGLIGITAGAVGLNYPLMCNGANLAFRREAFLKIGGYQDNYQYASGDDMFLLSKFLKNYGKKSAIFLGNPQAIVYTQAERTWNGFINQRIRWISKSRGYSDPFLLTLSVYTWLVHFILLAGVFIGFNNPHLLVVSIVLWFAKILAEYPLVLKMSGFFNKKHLLIYYFAAQLIQLIYVAIFGILGNFLPYRWKGRNFRR